MATAKASELLSAVKEAEPIGTWETPDVAFQLFAGARPQIFGSYGFLCTPQLGCYTADEYTPALPIAVISLPLPHEAYQLPPSIATVLKRCREMGVVKGEPELFVTIHSGHEHRPCGHLKCDNVDEFNVMLHPWVFAEDNVADTSDEIVAQVHVGVFEAHGVRPVHMDLVDGGTPFGLLSQRRVILHDRRFSPDNCNVQLDESVTDTPVFFTFAADKMMKKAVITLHVLPVGDAASDRVRGWIRDLPTLKAFATALAANVPVAYAHFGRLIAPLLGPGGGEGLPGFAPAAGAAAATAAAAAPAAGGSGTASGAAPAAVAAAAVGGSGAAAGSA